MISRLPEVKKWLLIWVGLGFLMVCSSGAEIPADELSGDLKKLSLEELFNVEVTSVSRKMEKASEVATALDVISDEDIRRTGAPNLPEALRLATGLHVAQVDGHTWAISSRGFNLTTANKLQVLMDGRSLYTPLFSGVFWDAQDTLMEDIARIEVVRGPGATMWGANAVNGVINIITKSARETQGALVLGGAGTEERGFGAIRYGGQLGKNTYYRTYLKHFNRDDLSLTDGRGARDEWTMSQGGFRTDSELSGDNLLTFQGDLYYGGIGQLTENEINLGGGNVLGRWTHQFTPESDLLAQLYYDRVYRDIPRLFQEQRDTLDFELQHRLPAGDRNDLIWGLNYRVSADEIENPMPSRLAFYPEEKTIQLFSFFLQDEIALVPERLSLILGSKLEHNDFTGFEYQPSVRLAFTPTERQTAWAAVSRAVRTPSRIDHDLRVPGVIAEDSGFDSEKLIAYELGYRVQLHSKVALDLATFFNDYDELRSQEPWLGGDRVFRNKLEGETYGLELVARVQLADWWRLRAGYTFLEKDLSLEPGSLDVTRGTTEGNDPDHIFLLHSSINLPGNWYFDGLLRYVDALPDPYVPGYSVLDLRLAWRPANDLEMALIGRNLLDDRHPEFGRPGPLRKEIEHSVYAKVTWRF